MTLVADDTVVSVTMTVGMIKDIRAAFAVCIGSADLPYFCVKDTDDRLVAALEQLGGTAGSLKEVVKKTYGKDI